MDRTLRPLAEIFALNTDLVLNGTEDVSTAQAVARLEGGGNSIAFLVAHLADARHYIAELLGSPLPNPLDDALAGAETIDDIEEMPPLSTSLDAWRSISAHLEGVLAGLAPADLVGRSGQRFPIEGETVLDALAFLAQHDSYHVGQIAFLRRQLGLPALKFTRRR